MNLTKSICEPLKTTHGRLRTAGGTHYCGTFLPGFTGQKRTSFHQKPLLPHYMNGMYWGIFMTQERAEGRFGASYFGGKSEDYDVIKPWGG